MPQGLGIQLGLGGGRSATPSGAPAGAAFAIDVFSVADILANNGFVPVVGTILFASDTYDLYVFDGTMTWYVYENTSDS